MKLSRQETPLVVNVKEDPITPEAIAPFDLTMDDPVEFYPFVLPALPEDYNIGLIVGSSGSGKSLLAKEFIGSQYIGGAYHPFHTIVAHFDTAEEAREKMYAVGLNSVPKWRLPFTALSTGEQHRAHVAKHLHDDGLVDEFTSTIDRDVAISLSVSVGRYIRAKGIKRMVFVTCHRDIIEPLRPDWIIDTDAEDLITHETTPPIWWGDMAGEKQGTIHLQWN
jgi:ABC-type ATPase with predicted acetyltransferase domain